MTVNEALELGEGDKVCHRAKLDYSKDGKAITPPLRITKVWVNEKRTIVLVRIASVGGEQWLDATGYELPPAGLAYDKLEREWITPKEFKARQYERRNGKRPEAVA